ncbi:39k [Cryptophlebia peltastica nucleopolyhedrovirus]|uniref:39k n=1 Tax=Cryptophlebia peltastica nucleopolyhedrovirus TaxID=2304025 RepID=A0A346RNP5_9ABAC|nr:39k [Cryptophlebia peltastica nucleopolyhedrovirus]AXS67692.1 39k [Cryptophlebia peltastica nucleopolyhedrovirus]
MAPQTLAEIINKSEQSVYNKTKNDFLGQNISLCEKKKMPYVLQVVPVYGDEKKNIKRSKKIISNNKYILFNSWYHSIKKEWYPSSCDMWNLMKTESADFINLFDFVEKLGKSIEVTNENEETKKHEIINAKRNVIYEQFYRLLTHTLDSENLHAPIDDPFYAYTVNNEKLNSSKIQNPLKTFVKVLYKKRNTSHSSTPTDVVPAPVRKRKNTKDSVKSNTTSKRVKKTEFVMSNDTFEDSQMSE